MSRRRRGHRCHWCRRGLEPRGSRGRLAATRDHVLPKSAGGSCANGGTTVWCCRHCNSLKADLLPGEWEAFMAANPEWWRREEYRAMRTVRVTWLRSSDETT